MGHATSPATVTCYLGLVTMVIFLMNLTITWNHIAECTAPLQWSYFRTNPSPSLPQYDWQLLVQHLLQLHAKAHCILKFIMIASYFTLYMAFWQHRGLCFPFCSCPIYQWTIQLYSAQPDHMTSYFVGAGFIMIPCSGFSKPNNWRAQRTSAE